MKDNQAIRAAALQVAATIIAATDEGHVLSTDVIYYAKQYIDFIKNGDGE